MRDLRVWRVCCVAAAGGESAACIAKRPFPDPRSVSATLSSKMSRSRAILRVCAFVQQPAFAAGQAAAGGATQASQCGWMLRAATALPRTTFARSVSSSLPRCSSSLATLLREEVGFEKKNYQRPANVSGGPPAPFKLTEKPGDTLLTLSRSYGSGEEVSVDLHVNNQPSPSLDGEEEGDDEVTTTVAFNVSVLKVDKVRYPMHDCRIRSSSHWQRGATARRPAPMPCTAVPVLWQVLLFECESDGNSVVINHVSLEPKDGLESESSYSGPVFDELDENMQVWPAIAGRPRDLAARPVAPRREGTCPLPQARLKRCLIRSVRRRRASLVATWRSAA
jgi:complement component 1 Q subcomponent-binding protein